MLAVSTKEFWRLPEPSDSKISFPSDSVPRITVLARPSSQAVSEHGESVLVWRLPQSSDSKIWSWFPWDSVLRITVLARTSSNLAVSQWALKQRNLQCQKPLPSNDLWRHSRLRRLSVCFSWRTSNPTCALIICSYVWDNWITTSFSKTHDSKKIFHLEFRYCHHDGNSESISIWTNSCITF
jgi:hypothetical protein